MGFSYIHGFWEIKGIEILKCWWISNFVFRPHLYEVDLTKIQVDHQTLSMACRLGFHVGFSSIHTSLVS